MDWTQKLIGKLWDSRSSHSKMVDRVRWWESPTIIQHINQKVCGQNIPGLSQGLNELVKTRFANRLPFRKAISIGAGDGAKELELIRKGIVSQIDLFEFSSVRIELGQIMARREGFSEQMTFHQKDAFSLDIEPEEYDLVYWNNALHHMFDVDKAVRWSYERLKNNGIFLMDDYVGSSKMQWSKRMRMVGTSVRNALPDKYLRNPYRKNGQLSRTISAPNRLMLKFHDPSEAYASNDIIPSIRRYFENPTIILTGGVVYHAALNDILHNFEEIEDESLLKILLAIDDLCTEIGDTHYAVAIAGKN